MAEPDKIEFGRTNPILTRPTRGVERIEFGAEGGSFLQRTGASIPSTTEGQVNFLEQSLGEGNVFTTKRGDILIRDPESGALVPFDEQAITFKDITADIVGPAMEAVPSAIGGLLGGGTPGSLVGAAGGAALGSLARIGTAEFLTGGETGQTLGEQVFEVGTAAAFGAAGKKVADIGAKVVDALQPGNFIARQTRKLRDTAFAKKGARLSEKTGIPFTEGEETGSRAVLMIEALARRTPGAADDMFRFNQDRLKNAVAGLHNAMNKIRPGQVGSFKAGTAISKNFDDAVDSAFQIRRDQARIDFSEVDRLSANRPLFSPKSLLAEIQKMSDELDVPGAGDATARVVRQANKMAGDLVDFEGPKKLTGAQMQRLLQVYTQAQRGTGAVFKDMGTAQSRMVSGRFKTALLRDLDEAADVSGAAGDAANAIKTARDHYRLNSAPIEEMRDSVLARVVGSRTASPEDIAEKLPKMRPSEIKPTMKFIERESPETAQEVRRFFVENAIENSRPAVTTGTAQGLKFSAAKFVGALPDINFMKAAGFTRNEIVETQRIAKALERVADKAFEGSPTAFAGISWDIARGLFTLNPVTMGRAVGAVIAPRMIAKATSTPEGRKALITLTKTGQTAKAIAQAHAVMTAIIATEPGQEDIRPLGVPENDRTMEDVLNGNSQ